MKIQHSRNPRRNGKDYSAVCHQQGRMITDADLSEQAMLSRDRLNEALADLVGSGVPERNGILRIERDDAGQDVPVLLWGRVYVDGIPARVRPRPDFAGEAFDYQAQWQYPDPPPLPEGRPFRLYVDVWERAITWLEDDSLRDPGLHGADTAARTRTVAQIKWCPADMDPECADQLPRMGTARLRMSLRASSSGGDPCDPCVEDLSLREPVGNYLFRVEVHDVGFDDEGEPETIVIKWSSENGAEAARADDLPPGFVTGRHVYEYFDEVTETRAGLHPAVDASGERYVDGNRPPLLADPEEGAPRSFVRRWDGWCRISRTDAGWGFEEGTDRGVDLSTGLDSSTHGHVLETGTGVELALDAVALTLELSGHVVIPGDHWSVPVRESVHAPGDWLLGGEEGGVPPEGEEHHYLLLVDVDADGRYRLPEERGCEVPRGCGVSGFPALSRLHARDVCFDGEACESLGESVSVQAALEHLCRSRDLRRHNRHLHGWGVVCGLVMRCDTQDSGSFVIEPGYAIDCEGNDLIIETPVNCSVEALLADSEEVDLSKGGALEVELFSDGSGGVGVRLRNPAERDDSVESWARMFDACYGSLLDGLVELDGAVASRCAATACDEMLLPPSRRRLLVLANVQRAAERNDGAVLIARCEYELLRDLHEDLLEQAGRRTVCDTGTDAFPDYPLPYDDMVGTWHLPEGLDRMEVGADGDTVFCWNSDHPDTLYVLRRQSGARGGLVAVIRPPVRERSRLVDLVFDDDERLFLVYEEYGRNSRILWGSMKPEEVENESCDVEIDWEVGGICGSRIARMRPSPWKSGVWYVVVRDRGLFIVSEDTLLSGEAIDVLETPAVEFPAAGPFAIDEIGGWLVCAEREEEASNLDVSDDSGYTRLRVVQVDGDGMVGAHHGVPLGMGDNSRNLRAVSAPLIHPGSEDGLRFDVVASVSRKHNRLFRYHLDRDMLENGDVRSSASLYLEQSAKWYSLARLSVDNDPVTVAVPVGGRDAEVFLADVKDGMRLPTQEAPVAARTGAGGAWLYVLNRDGQSISVLDGGILNELIDRRDALRDFARDVDEVFTRPAQALRACFFNQLLISCPEPCEEGVGIGSIELPKDGAARVSRICNFTGRRFVKTFPAVSHWLSIFPLEAVVARTLQQLVCPEGVGEKGRAENRSGPLMSIPVVESMASLKFFDHVGALRAGGVGGHAMSMKRQFVATFHEMATRFPGMEHAARMLAMWLGFGGHAASDATGDAPDGRIDLRIRELEKRLDDVEGDCARWTPDIPDTPSDDVGVLSNQVEILEQRVDSLDVWRSSHSDTAVSGAEMNELLDRVGTLENRVRSLEAWRGSHSDTVTSPAADIQNLTNQIQALSDEVATLQGELQASRAHCQSLAFILMNLWVRGVFENAFVNKVKKQLGLQSPPRLLDLVAISDDQFAEIFSNSPKLVSEVRKRLKELIEQCGLPRG